MLPRNSFVSHFLKRSIASTQACYPSAMQFQSTILLFGALLSPVLAAPAATKVLQPRGASQCAQYSSISTGAFTISSNEWGASTSGTTGSQCSYIDSLTGNSLAWHTTWTWAGSSSQVKSYTNVQVTLPQDAVSAYTTIPTTWSWSYTGTNLACNGTCLTCFVCLTRADRCTVAYDTFLGASATGTNLFEVMVWLGDYGGVSPLSANGKSISV